MMIGGTVTDSAERSTSTVYFVPSTLTLYAVAGASDDMQNEVVAAQNALRVLLRGAQVSSLPAGTEKERADARDTLKNLTGLSDGSGVASDIVVISAAHLEHIDHLILIPSEEYSGSDSDDTDYSVPEASAYVLTDTDRPSEEALNSYITDCESAACDGQPRVRIIPKEDVAHWRFLSQRHGGLLDLADAIDDPAKDPDNDNDTWVLPDGRILPPPLFFFNDSSLALTEAGLTASPMAAVLMEHASRAMSQMTACDPRGFQYREVQAVLDAFTNYADQEQSAGLRLVRGGRPLDPGQWPDSTEVQS
jgi:hypothetical protein